MAYSIKVILHNLVDKKGLQKIFIQVLCNRFINRIATEFKITADQFKDEAIIGHPFQKKMNIALKGRVHMIEGRIIDAISNQTTITAIVLQELVHGAAAKKGVFGTFVTKIVLDYKEKFSDSTLSHYLVVRDKVELFRPDVQTSSIDLEFMQDFEGWLRKGQIEKGILVKLDGNTIQNNMKMFKSIMHKAAELNLADKDIFTKYKVPKYVPKIPEYLTEDEVSKVFAFVELIEKPGMKRAGYYFLLSCFTGFRISDATTFDYDSKVKDDKIILRATKNKKIVSIPVYPRLQKVLDFIQHHPLNMSEQHLREYVSDICKMVGIKKHVKFHTSRHSFGMMLANNGFSLEEAAEMLGDTLEVARIYFHISNERLEAKVKERLG